MATHDPIFDYDDSAERAAMRQPAYNAEKARKPIVKRIERAIDSFKSATPLRGRKPFKYENGHYEFQVPFIVNGKSDFTRSAETFEQTLVTLLDRIKTGVYDEAIKIGLVSDPQAEKIAPKRPKSSGVTRPLSPESLARRRAKVAAKAAAQAKA